MDLNPGDIAIDFSGARPDPKLVASLGVKLIVRYVSAFRNNPKNATRREIQAALDAGLSVALVFEQAKTDALGGAARGRVYGPIGDAFVRDLGYPFGSTLYVACDVDAMPSQMPTVTDYLGAFASTCSYPIKPYGEADVVTAAVLAGICRGGWQCRAWSYGRRSPYAEVLQEIGLELYPQLKQLGNVDANTVLKPFSAWSLDMSPPPKEEEVSNVRRFCRDDRKEGEWQAWFQDVDWKLIAWATPVNMHAIPWEAYADLVLPVVSFDVLDALPHEPTPDPGGAAGPLRGTWST